MSTHTKKRANKVVSFVGNVEPPIKRRTIAPVQPLVRRIASVPLVQPTSPSSSSDYDEDDNKLVHAQPIASDDEDDKSSSSSTETKPTISSEEDKDDDDDAADFISGLYLRQVESLSLADLLTCVRLHQATRNISNNNESRRAPSRRCSPEYLTTLRMDCIEGLITNWAVFEDFNHLSEEDISYYLHLQAKNEKKRLAAKKKSTSPDTVVDKSKPKGLKKLLESLKNAKSKPEYLIDMCKAIILGNDDELPQGTTKEGVAWLLQKWKSS